MSLSGDIWGGGGHWTSCLNPPALPLSLSEEAPLTAPGLRLAVTRLQPCSCSCFCPHSSGGRGGGTQTPLSRLVGSSSPPSAKAAASGPPAPSPEEASVWVLRQGHVFMEGRQSLTR